MLPLERRALLCGDGSVLGQPALHRVAAQATAARTRQEGLLGGPAAVSHPRPERRHGVAAKGSATLFPPFSQAANMGAAVEGDVFMPQADKLGDPKACLEG